MKKEFYIKDEPAITSLTGVVTQKKDVLYFRCPIRTAGTDLPPGIHDEKATADNVKSYPLEYEAFEKQFVGKKFVPSWERSEEAPGSFVSVPVEVVEEDLPPINLIEVLAPGAESQLLAADAFFNGGDKSE